MARSGQTYGINGSVILATSAMEDKVVSDHVIRIAPRSSPQIRMGYIYVALSHPELGRPLVKSLAYGSSIPEIDPVDFAEMEIVRLSPQIETAIADLAEASAAHRAQADVLERELATNAGALLDRFLAGDSSSFVTTVPAVASKTNRHPSLLNEHEQVRLRADVSTEGLTTRMVGTIVHIYADDAAYEVEFIRKNGESVVVTLEANQVVASAGA